MARDAELEAAVAADFEGVEGLATKAMFGGLGWLHRGNLVCGSNATGLMVRLGPGRDGWLRDLGVTGPLMPGGREMAGWLRIEPAASRDPALRRRALEAAMDFVRTLPPKELSHPRSPRAR